MNKYLKIILICSVVMLVGAGIIYFGYLRNNNTFIKTNVKVSLLWVDDKPLDFGKDSKNSWNTKLSSGKHVISIDEPGYLSYFEIIDSNKYLPEFLNIQLTAAEFLGTPVIPTLPDNIVASMSSGSNINYSTLSSDEKNILYYNPATKEISQFIFDTKNKSNNQTKAMTKLDFLSTDATANVVYSLDKTQALVTTLPTKTTSPEFWVVSLTKGTKTKLNDNITNIRTAVFTGDGKKVAVMAGDSKTLSIFLTSSDGSNSQKIIDIDQFSYGLNISPNGATISYLTSSNNGVVLNLVNSSNKQKKQVATNDKVFLGKAPVWSPDSSQLIYMFNQGAAILVSKDGKASGKISGGEIISKVLWSVDGKTIIQSSTNSSNKGQIFLSQLNSSGKKLKALATLTQSPDEIFISKDSQSIYLNLGGSYSKISGK